MAHGHFKTPPDPKRRFTIQFESYFNSEGFLAEVFHPWVFWEEPGFGFENSSGAGGAGGGVLKSRIHKFGPLWIEVEKHGF